MAWFRFDEKQFSHLSQLQTTSVFLIITEIVSLLLTTSVSAQCSRCSEFVFFYCCCCCCFFRKSSLKKTFVNYENVICTQNLQWLYEFLCMQRISSSLYCLLSEQKKIRKMFLINFHWWQWSRCNFNILLNKMIKNSDNFFRSCEIFYKRVLEVCYSSFTNAFVEVPYSSFLPH